MIDRLLSEELAVSLIQIGLVLTLYDSRDLSAGTAQYAESLFRGAVDLYAVLAISTALYTWHQLFIARRPRFTPMQFAVTSVPLLLFIGTSVVYVVANQRSLSAVFALVAFYVYFVGRVILRQVRRRRRQQARVEGG